MHSMGDFSRFYVGETPVCTRSFRKTLVIHGKEEKAGKTQNIPQVPQVQEDPVQASEIPFPDKADLGGRRVQETERREDGAPALEESPKHGHDEPA